MITPLDIENKEFQRGVRGYKEKEVDDFLDLIILDFEQLLQENKTLTAEVKNLEEDMTKYKASEKSVLETLETAKKLMNDISESAEKRADILLKNAVLDAELIQREAKDSVKRVTDESIKIKDKFNKFKEKYRGMLEYELENFDDRSEDLFADFEKDFLFSSPEQNCETVKKDAIKPAIKEDLGKTRIL